MGNDSLGVTSEVYKNQLRFHNLYLWNNWAELNLVRTFPFIHFEPLTKKKKKRKKEIPWKKNEQNLLLDSTEGGMRQTTAKMLPSFAAWGNGHRRREREGCDGFCFGPRGMWDLGSQNRDQTRIPCSGSTVS